MLFILKLSLFFIFGVCFAARHELIAAIQEMRTDPEFRELLGDLRDMYEEFKSVIRDSF